MTRQATAEDYQRRILRAQRMISERLDESIAPIDLANAASFSLHHFHRIFRAQLGESVMEHVRRLRLERAARLLRCSDERILTLAIAAGYESHEAFTRAFTDRFSMSPSAYRAAPSLRLAEWAATRQPRKAEVAVVTYPALRVAYTRHRGSYRSMAAFWQKMVSWAACRGLMARETPLYGVCPDDPEVTPEEHLRFDACVLVDEGFVPDGIASVQEIPGGTYAVGLHVGPYERLAETYLDVIGRWAPTSGRELAAEPAVEHYLNDPSIAAPHELRTEVRVRLDV